MNTSIKSQKLDELFTAYRKMEISFDQLCLSLANIRFFERYEGNK